MPNIKALGLVASDKKILTIEEEMSFKANVDDAQPTITIAHYEPKAQVG